MVIETWKPKYNKKGNKIEYYYLVDNNYLFENRTKNLKVIYRCDGCKKKSYTISGSLLDERYTNMSLERQLCRSCRSKINERERNNTVNFTEFKKILNKEGYTILSNKEDFDFSDYPSQTKIKVKCREGHVHYVTWNNFVIQGKRCRQCYLNEKYYYSTVNDEGYWEYRSKVLRYTFYTMRKFYIEGIEKRGKEYHLDHKFSIVEGFRNNIPPYILGSKCNLEVIPREENSRKGENCSITKEELLENYHREVK